MKKILVDMSCTLIHHGHIRLIKKAKKYGKVFIGLCSDQEIKRRKKIVPELKFAHRKEIALSIKDVSGVIKSKFYIRDAAHEPAKTSTIFLESGEVHA